VKADESQVADGVLEALEDDINTPKALAALYALSSAANKEPDLAARSVLKGKLLHGGALLGLLKQNPKVWFQGADEGDITAEQIETLILERVEAKTNKNYARSDEIRDTLKDQGIVLEDGPQGTTWKRV